MKKAIVIILAVAILGVMALYTDNKKSTGYHLVPGPTSTSTGVQASTSSSSTNQVANPTYKDGTYNGSPTDNPYGTVQIAAVISGGKITDIKFLQMPGGEDHTNQVTSFSEPLLKQSALHKQSANIDFVSGATDTSFAFEQSLQAALDQAAGG